jgi:hypothetical protein
MSNRKLRLDPEQLAVVSFSTVLVEEGRKGTVHGHGYVPLQPSATESDVGCSGGSGGSGSATAGATCAYTCGNTCGSTCNVLAVCAPRYDPPYSI